MGYKRTARSRGRTTTARLVRLPLDRGANTRPAAHSISWAGTHDYHCGWPQVLRLAGFLVVVLLVAFLLFASRTAQAGAWTLPEGKGQAIITGTFLKADRYFDSRGQTIRGPDYRKFEVTAFIEYGLTDSLTAILSPSLLSTRVSGPEPAQYTGLGYTEAGARYRLFEHDGWIVSAQAIAGFPGPTNALNPAEVCCTDKYADARILVGKSFRLGDWPTFVDAQAAYRLRSGAANDEIRFDLTLGVRPLPKWLFLAQSFNVLAMNALASGSTLGLLSGTRYHKVQVGVVWDFADDWSLQLAGVATIAGKSAPLEHGLVSGLWYRF
ncbi:hypothetical protein [Chelatococcus sp.]|uniref:hypothetical protein n=1 Tax=Chelatococcus sp. TaxID=1953771 RepID=UPI001ECFF9D9|nr:hypothetical protein [Chelatococcus sp.]MBX3546865.1 hypothetical protein [Chelatococcus sp.]CAH1669065.1 conserved hypothetical protein [Hyphomicrobiales bacterium]CAH1679476.1 conserved hypothetical protein [Hyphomicrobiales bacterium]